MIDGFAALMAMASVNDASYPDNEYIVCRQFNVFYLNAL